MRELFGFLGQVERKVLMVNWAGDKGLWVTRPVVLGFSLSCRFFIRGEPPNKNAASRAPFQDSAPSRILD
jgi:hypothetical protein